MRKTTVDQLAEKAGISKGAFYKFYETKEQLFFEVLEDWHEEIYKAAWQKWEAHSSLPTPQRVAEVLLEVCRMMEKNAVVDFSETDLPYLLRKIPADVLAEHYHSDDVHIREMIVQMGIELREPAEVAVAAIRSLILSLSHRNQIGEVYPRVLELFIRGICEQLVV